MRYSHIKSMLSEKICMLESSIIWQGRSSTDGKIRSHIHRIDGRPPHRLEKNGSNERVDRLDVGQNCENSVTN